MSTYTRKDMALLQEAYELQLLRENIVHMSLNDIEKQLPTLTEAQINFVNDGVENIINEFWGGLKNIGKAVGGGVKNVAGGLAQSAKNVAGAALDKTKEVGQNAINAGKAGAQQFGANASNIYQKGQIQQRQSQAVKKGLQMIEQLKELITQAENDGVLSKGGPPFEDMSISELIEYLQGSSDIAAANANKAAQGGFTQGVGSAMKQAWQGK